MATISGFLKFDQTRTGVFSATLGGIANVPIILQNTATNAMLAVYTDANGMYRFTNVPNGSYRLVEAYGAPAVASPGDFAAAGVGAPAASAFPPISYAPNPPADATNLDGVNRTTRLVTVAGADPANQNFLNGPVRYSPIHNILDRGVTILPGNLITAADNGTFGSFAPGTAANTGANPNPYPDIGAQFTYVLPNPAGVTPGGGAYTIQNTMNNATANVQNTWWRIADHTAGNETGRMMVVNGDSPGKTIFQQQVTVKPNTYYLMSAWIMNLSKSAALVDPQLGVQVLDSNGQVIYNATLGTLIPYNAQTPEWKQIGTMINSKNNTSLTLRFTSMGPETVGNDYAIDDIALNEVQIQAYAPHKTADTAAAHVGDIVTYTVTLTNTGADTLRNVKFHDALPEGMTFIPGSVTLNGLASPSADPNQGMLWPNVVPGATITLIFQAVADYIPAVNPTINKAETSYSYTPVVGGIPDDYTTVSNEVVIPIAAAQADLTVKKSGRPNPVMTGDTLIYMITAANQGPNAAQDVRLTDNIPGGLQNPQYSADGGQTWQRWTGNLAMGEMRPGETAAILLRGTVGPNAAGVLTNTVTINSSTTDPNPDNNSDTALIPINSLADLSLTKIGDQSPVQAGDVITFTLTAANHGPNTAEKVIFSDQTAANWPTAEYSTDGGVTWQPWTGSYQAGNLAPGSSAAILLRGPVSPTATGNLVNTAAVSSLTSDPVPDNNSRTVITPIVALADLAMVKTAAPNPVPAGSRINYSLTAHNNGPNPARSVTVTDTLPAGLQNPEYSADGGVTWQSWNGAYPQEVLAAGADLNLLLRGTVGENATGMLTNTATVSSTTNDPNPDNNSDTTITPITNQADLAITKAARPNPAPAGSMLTYTLTAVNHGPNPARNVTVTDAAPNALMNPEYSVDGGSTWQPWTGAYTVGSLPAGANAVALLRGTVNSEATGTLRNTATVTGSTPDPNPDNNTVTVTTPINTAADLQISKSGDKNPVQAGDMLTYTVNVFNNGPNPAAAAVLTDPVPAALLNPEYSVDGGSTWQPWNGSYNPGTLPENRGFNLLIRGTVDPTAAGVLTNTARIDSPTPDPVPENNEATVLTPVNTAADMMLTKTTGQTTIPAGGQLTYTLTAHNNGPNPARNVTITDRPPAALTALEYSADGGLTWQTWNGQFTLDEVPAGSDVVIMVRGTVSNSADGTLTNSATVTSDTPDPNPNNNAGTVLTPVTTLADLNLKKTAAPAEVQPGDRLTYTLTAANRGPNDARNVTVLDNMPLSLINQEYSADGGITWRQWRGGYSLAGLAAGASATIMLRGTVSNTAVGMITNAAAVTSPTPDPNSDNNSDTALTPVTTQADLQVTKSADREATQTGDILTYTLVVTNNGPNPARDLTLTDALPEGLTAPEYSADGGLTWQPWDGLYHAAALNNGGSITLLIRGTVTSSAGDVLVNTAAVSSLTPDNIPDNNSDTVLTPVNKRADLALTKTAAPDPVEAGGTLTYTLTAANRGPDPARGVTVFDQPPTDLLGTQYSADGGLTWRQWQGGFTFGDLAADSSATLLIRGTVSQNAAAVLANTATVTGPTPDPNPDNNSNTTLTPVITAADLIISKTAAPQSVRAGELLTYTLTAVNNGPCPARNVTLSDPVPAGLTAAEYSTDNGVTWQMWNGSYTLTDLPAGNSAAILIRGTVSPDMTGPLNNTATVDSSTPDPNPNNNNVTVVTPVIEAADLTISKTGAHNQIQTGALQTYTLTVTNNGPGTAKNVTVNDRIPPGLTDAEYSADGGVTWQPWPGSHPFPRLDPGHSATLLLRGTVGVTGGTLSNSAVVGSSTPDPNPNNNQATAVTPVISDTADLCVRKKVWPSLVSPCEEVTYTITVRNIGRATAENVVLRDRIPEPISDVSYSVDGGHSWHLWHEFKNLGALPPGEMLTVLINGTVNRCAAGEITNYTEVMSTTADADLSNNRAEATVTVCR